MSGPKPQQMRCPHVDHLVDLLLIAILVLLSPVHLGATQRLDTRASGSPRTRGTVIWYDDMESGGTGWSHRDDTWGLTPHFHVNTYMAFEGERAWWCGSFDFDSDGGYGDQWDDRLELPPIDVSGAGYPVLTFAHYYHSEPGSDFTYLQVRNGSEFIDLNPGYSGLIPGGSWLDLGVYGYVVEGYDHPLKIRFRFLSDGAVSDEDGGFDSTGGAYHIDNIKIFDYYGGETYFLDDVESGGLCYPSIRPAVGDFWHIIDRQCAAYSNPRSWWCGDDADTGHIPPNLDNSLESPAVDLSGLGPSVTCTLRYMLHAEVPTVDNDYWSVYASVDGGVSWYQLGAYWGDFESCDGWGDAGIAGHGITHLLPGTSFKFMIRFFTTSNGCGPGVAGGAGIALDDIWLETTSVPVENRSWGRVKALYR